MQSATKIVETKEREVRIIKESSQREKTLGQLLSKLNAEKSEVMGALLESVQTPKLEAAFNKYLPAVLNTGSEIAPKKKALTESVIAEATGDKTAKKTVEVDITETDNVIDLKRLAGL